MPTDQKLRISRINWLGIGIVVWLVLYLAIQFFIGNQPAFAFVPFGLIWLLLIGVLLFLAYRVYVKPDKSSMAFAIFTVLLVVNICLLIFEACVQYERGTLYYWRSFKDILQSAILWFWLKYWCELATSRSDEPKALSDSN